MIGAEKKPDLLPCPFCGSADVGFPFNDRPNRWVTCYNCECDGPSIRIGVPIFPEPDAVRLWNTRSEK